MNTVRTRPLWNNDDLAQRGDEMIAIRARFWRNVEILNRSENLENSENTPSFEAPSVDVVLRPSPRVPLQDITHLYSFNVPNSSDKMEIVRRVMGRIRPIEAPLVSRKRSVQQANLPTMGHRQSAALRSFR